MPYKNPLTAEQIAKRRERNLRSWHKRKGSLTEEQRERMRAHSRKSALKWRAEHREEANASAREAMRKARAERPEEIREQLRQSYYRHHEKRKAEKRERHAANRDENNALRRQWSADNPEKEKATKRIVSQRARTASPWMAFWRAAQKRAIKKDVPFSITPEDLKGRWTGRCEITGIEFDHSKITPGAGFFSPSLDRIRPELGYTPTNVRFILWAVNAFKGTGNDEDMLRVARAILENYSIISKS